MENQHDIRILRELAGQYAQAAADPIQDQRRQLWTAQNSLEKTRPLLIAGFGMWNVWCREVYGDGRMQCRDPFYREHERNLRMRLFHYSYRDDTIFEPWYTIGAVRQRGWGSVWGVPQAHREPGVEGGAWQFDPPIRDWSDVARLSPPPHQIDEAATAANLRRLQDAIGDILPVNVSRAAVCQEFLADISTDIAQLRGLEQIMMDMYDSPRELHSLLAFMRDGILGNQQAAEDAGDWGLADQSNQSMPYARETQAPAPNAAGQKRRDLWCHCAAQEFTLISPMQHEEFLLQYQLPILSKFGLVSYGCCEDLTPKIDLLRKIPNLRMIAVTPRADLRRCAELIGTDYVISWRPNPTDVICYGFDETRIRRIIREAVEATRGCHLQIDLKDVETVEGQPQRFERFVQIVREVIDRHA
jgi:hypothetical protein